MTYLGQISVAWDKISLRFTEVRGVESVTSQTHCHLIFLFRLLDYLQLLLIA